MLGMSTDYTRQSPTSGGSPIIARQFSRQWRLLAGITFVFVAGVGLGALLGTWLAKPELPLAQVALELQETPYEVTTRAYRPLGRKYKPAALPEKQSAFVKPQKTTETSDIVAEVETKSDRENAVSPVDTPDLEPDTQTRIPLKTGVLMQKRRRGNQRWLANAAPAPAIEGRPMIAIVIDDLGLSQTRVKQTIALPSPITLAFLPYGHNLKKLTKEGRAAGHELIIHVNMEPKDHDIDPGPKALLTTLEPDEVHRRLLWAFDQFDGYIGISNHMGSRFTEWPDGMEVVVKALKRRGLLYFDSVTSTKSVGPALARAHGMAYASRDVFLDHNRTAEAVARQLAQTERIALSRGYAIAIGHPHNVTIDALRNWMPSAAERGFVMVPLSAIVRHRLGEG